MGECIWLLFIRVFVSFLFVHFPCYHFYFIIFFIFFRKFHYTFGKPWSDFQYFGGYDGSNTCDSHETNNTMLLTIIIAISKTILYWQLYMHVHHVKNIFCPTAFCFPSRSFHAFSIYLSLFLSLYCNVIFQLCLYLSVPIAISFCTFHVWIRVVHEQFFMCIISKKGEPFKIA